MTIKLFTKASAALVATLLAVPALAQVQPTAAEQQQAEEAAAVQMQISMTQAQRQAIIAQELVLEPETAEKFWEVYRDYSNDRAKLSEQDWKLIVRFRDNFGAFTEEEAKAIVNEALKLEQSALSLKKRYLSRFRRVLTEKQMLTYYQLENKMDAILAFEFAQNIPLAQ